MYHSRLLAHESVSSQALSDLAPDCPFERPLLLVDTAGSLMHESVEQTESKLSESKSNPGEADLVLQIIQELLPGVS